MHIEHQNHQVPNGIHNIESLIMDIPAQLTHVWMQAVQRQTPHAGAAGRNSRAWIGDEMREQLGREIIDCR